MGSIIGVLKIAANRIGISEKEYRREIASGRKWCWRCKKFHLRTDFISDRTRGDGLSSCCKQSRNAWYRKKYKPRPNPKPGRRFVLARDGDKRQSRRRINYLVEIGLLPKPGDISCVDCGHVGAGRRHEYDHFLGYSIEHQEHVQAVCTPCHHRRSRRRGECRGKAQ